MNPLNESGMGYDPKGLKLFARGGQADIYSLEDGRLLRVLRDVSLGGMLKDEMLICNALKAHGILVPEVYDHVIAGGLPALVVERVGGNTLLAGIRKKPWKIKSFGRELGEMHVRFAGVTEDLGLVSGKERAEKLISPCSKFPEDVKAFVLECLEVVKDGNGLCHGDFHPGNLMDSPKGLYIIDWFGAYRGPVISDVAHSYLLMSRTPRLPGSSNMSHSINIFMGGLLSGAYLKGAAQAFGSAWDWEDFGGWLVIKAAERVVYGLPGEEPKLLEFINMCKDRGLSGNRKSWHAFL